MRQGKVKEATATSDQLIKAAPDNPLVKQLRGQIAAAGGDYEKARTLLEEAVAAMPENYQATLLLGMVNMQQGNLGQAEMHLPRSWPTSQATCRRNGCWRRSAPARSHRRKRSRL